MAFGCPLCFPDLVVVVGFKSDAVLFDFVFKVDFSSLLQWVLWVVVVEQRIWAKPIGNSILRVAGSLSGSSPSTSGIA